MSYFRWSLNAGDTIRADSPESAFFAACDQVRNCFRDEIEIEEITEQDYIDAGGESYDDDSNDDDDEDREGNEG